MDLLDVVYCLFNTSQAMGGEGEQQPSYVTWQGQVAKVVADLEQVGSPTPDEELAASDPRRVLAEEVTYLRNNAGRMDYPRYRREGLPTTSSLVESLVGEFKTRVKGRSKFWNRPVGAEAIL